MPESTLIVRHPSDERDAQGCKRHGILALPVQRHAFVAGKRGTQIEPDSPDQARSTYA